MKNTRDDIEEFNQKVSEFSGAGALANILKYYGANPQQTAKRLFYPMAEEIPFSKKMANNRGKSQRQFSEKMTIREVEHLVSQLYDIPMPGGFDVVHCFMVLNTEEYKGIAYSDLTNGIRLVNEKVDPLLLCRELYGDAVVNNSSIDFKGMGASLFFFVEMPKFVEKYQHLAYDYAMMLGGMLLQNGYLVAEELGLKKCALGCYSKQKARDIFGRGNDFICVTNLIIGG